MKMIDGFREITILFNDIRVTATAPQSKLFTPDVIVEETDTYCVVKDQNEFRMTEEHPVRILTKAFHSAPVKTGSVITTASEPLHLLAVIYDLDQDPLCTPDAISKAWRQIFTIAEREQCRHIATPLLGQRSKTLSFHQRCDLLGKALERKNPDRERHIWLFSNGDERRRWSAYVEQTIN